MAPNDIALRARVFANNRLTWLRGPGKQVFARSAQRFVRRLQRNLEPRRLLSFPHVLVLFWVVVLLWGERWVFGSKVDSCAWEEWESWPKDAKPHRLVLLADPQIIDPHSYPSRSALLESLTLVVTDNYLRRSHTALQRSLRPDTVMFLGDLFDGGREWATKKGTTFADPKWGRGRGREEREWVDTWRKLYGEDFWLDEYKRFGDIFFKGFREGGDQAGGWQRGRKLVASLPGNHDLGFGAQVQVPVRDRFEAFFGDVNRVDVIGNHSFVSVDTVSLSADTSEYAAGHDLKPIYGPAAEFLDNVKDLKRRAVARELGVWFGETDDGGAGAKFAHEVAKGDVKPERFPTPPGQDGKTVDLPTILLSHVPLYREPGTPCGPKREHWPPTKPPPGQTGPVVPDHRNALSITAGYQYQNVLSDSDSINLVRKIGNVVHAFSGDDHDYCEVVHSPVKESVREITVKSLSMAMGVPTPGFVMVSLWNPVDRHGNPLVDRGAGRTMQTRLCLLPNQLHTYMVYVTLIVASLAVLALRAVLVPVLHLAPFALGEEAGAGAGGVRRKGGFLPLARAAGDDGGKKFDAPDHDGRRGPGDALGGGSSALRNPASARARAGSIGSGWQSAASSAGRSSRREPGRWGWGGGAKGAAGGHGGREPKIRLDEEYYYPGMRAQQEAGRGGRRWAGVVGREMWTSTWRVAWMAVGVWIWLTRRG